MVEHIGVGSSIGFDVLLDGTIPRCAGLSSSSALVCCSALVTMHVYEKQISRVCTDFAGVQLVCRSFHFEWKI
jgi:N-acetylgalactosamine kinase